MDAKVEDGHRAEQPNTTQQTLTLLFNFVSTIAVTLVNKACFSRISFGFPAALCCVHFTITWLGLEVMRQKGYFQPINRPPVTEPQYGVMLLTMGVVTSLNNTSLKLNSVGFYQMFKLLVTPFVVILEYLLDGRSLSAPRGLALLVVCIGVIGSSRFDLQFSVQGTASAVAWVPLAAVYKVQWGRLVRIYKTSTPAMMHAILPGATVIQMMFAPLVDPPGLFQFEWTLQACFWIFLSGLAAFFVNLSGFMVLGDISALAHVVLGQMKSCVIIVLAYLLFGAAYTTPQVLGAGIAIGAIVCYTYVTLLEKPRTL